MPVACQSRGVTEPQRDKVSAKLTDEVAETRKLLDTSSVFSGPHGPENPPSPQRGRLSQRRRLAALKGEGFLSAFQRRMTHLKPRRPSYT